MPAGPGSRAPGDAVLVETEEFKEGAPQTLRDLVASFDRWAGLLETTRHNEVAETVLEESGYTDMWRRIARRTPPVGSRT